MKKFLKRLFPSNDMKAYKKRHNARRKELINHAKISREWDWCYLHESVIMQIRHMYDYYTAGNNVWQCDESRLKIIDQLKCILDLNDEIVQFDDKEWNIEQEEHLQELYEKLYGLIGKNLRYWWD